MASCWRCTLYLLEVLSVCFRATLDVCELMNAELHECVYVSECVYASECVVRCDQGFQMMGGCKCVSECLP